VRDEGIGVQLEDRVRIFEYLYRAPSAQKRNVSGLGLGLYVSRFLAERMGGSLELVRTSVAAPSGSVFRLSLPLSAP
ncbi:MAG TPA: ATP-binding protein, partial [Ktedonobacterales bacterium]|nr:ATP-binding protein [Ktedonobacterales bacterium]